MLNEQEIIDRYFNDEMDKVEREAFEKAMENDAELAKTVALNKDLMTFFQERNPKSKRKITTSSDKFLAKTLEPNIAPSTDIRSIQCIKWSIGIVSLLIVSFFVIRLSPISQSQSQDTEHSDMGVENVTSHTTQHEGETEAVLINEQPQEQIQEERKPNPEAIDENQSKGNNPIAVTDLEKFMPNAVLENLIGENVHSFKGGTSITFPKTGYSFVPKNKITDFSIKGTVSDNQSIDIIVYDNQPESFTNNKPVLLTSKVLKPGSFSYNLSIELKPGAYYYIIRNKETTSIIHISKFFVEK